MEWRYKEWIKCPDCGNRARVSSIGPDKIHLGYKCKCGFETRVMSKHLVFGDGDNLKILGGF